MEEEIAKPLSFYTPKKWKVIDTDKITTLEDVKAILRVMTVHVDENHEEYEGLKHLVKDESDR